MLKTSTCVTAPGPSALGIGRSAGKRLARASDNVDSDAASGSVASIPSDARSDRNSSCSCSEPVRDFQILSHES